MINGCVEGGGIGYIVENFKHNLSRPGVDQNSSAFRNLRLFKIRYQGIEFLCTTLTTHCHKKILVHATLRSNHILNVQSIFYRNHSLRISSSSQSQNRWITKPVFNMLEQNFS